MRHHTALAGRDSLSHRQVNTDPAGRYRITKTYTTDPSRSVLLMRVRFESRTPLQLYALYDPGLSNGGDDDTDDADDDTDDGGDDDGIGDGAD